MTPHTNAGRRTVILRIALGVWLTLVGVAYYAQFADQVSALGRALRGLWGG
jgi:hypothetical protein